MGTIQTTVVTKKVRRKAEECPLCAKYGHVPNAETQAAMAEADAGEVETYTGSTSDIFDRILKNE